MEASELDALIASNIGDLEAALNRVKKTIDPELNTLAWDTLKQSLEHVGYHFEDGGDLNDSWFAPASWLDEDGDSDPWFRLNARDGSRFETWLARFAAPNSQRNAIGIQWYHQCLYVRDYKAILLAHSDELVRIEKAGFHRDGNDIYLPISFNASKLADGFRDGELAEALTPIITAAEALEKARPAFQCIRDAMVAKAKG